MDFNKDLQLEYLGFNNSGEIELNGFIKNKNHFIEAYGIKARVTDLSANELIEFIETQDIEFIEIGSLGRIDNPYLIDLLIEDTSINNRDFFIDLLDSKMFDYFSRVVCADLYTLEVSQLPELITALNDEINTDYKRFREYMVRELEGVKVVTQQFTVNIADEYLNVKF